MVLEARSPRSQQGTLSKGLGENHSLPLIAPSNPCHSLACNCTTSISVLIFTGPSFLCIWEFSNLSLFIETPIIEFRVLRNPVWPYLNLVTPAKTLFLNKVLFKGTRVRTSTYLFAEHSSTHCRSHNEINEWHGHWFFVFFFYEKFLDRAVIH